MHDPRSQRRHRLVCPTITLGVLGGDRVQGADTAVGYESVGPQCLQYHDMHALSICDMISYPYAKSKINELILGC